MIAQKQFFLHTLIKKQDCKLYAYLVTISFPQTQRVQLLWFRTAGAPKTPCSRARAGAKASFSRTGTGAKTSFSRTGRTMGTAVREL